MIATTTVADRLEASDSPRESDCTSPGCKALPLLGSLRSKGTILNEIVTTTAANVRVVLKRTVQCCERDVPAVMAKSPIEIQRYFLNWRWQRAQAIHIITPSVRENYNIGQIGNNSKKEHQERTFSIAIALARGSHCVIPSWSESDSAATLR